MSHPWARLITIPLLVIGFVRLGHVLDVHVGMVLQRSKVPLRFEVIPKGVII